MPDPLRRRWRAGAVGALCAVARAVPAPLLRPGFAAAAAWARRGELGRTARTNLELAYAGALSPAERERIVRATFEHATRLATHWLALSRGAPPEGPRRARGAWIDARVVVDPSIEILERELARGRGAIVVTAHIGDWELLCAALRRRGIHGSVVAHVKRRDPLARRWIELREGYGVPTLPQVGSARRALEVLERGETLGLLCDLEVRRLAGAFVPFFGRPAWTMSAPAALARVRGQPLVPARCVRESGGAWRLSVDPPLALRPELDRRAGTLELLARLNATYERWIRADPEQWAWHQPRWRRQP